MLSTVYQSPLKLTANTAAADTNDTAMALREQSAAFVSFQRQPPSLPPAQNVLSAPRSLTSAVQFSGSIAKYAAIATTFATVTTF